MKHIGKFWVTALLLFAFLAGHSQWNSLSINPTTRISSFQFLDDNLGYAMQTIDQTGALSLAKTADGGMTWTPIPLPVLGYEFQAFHFSASGVGVVVIRNLQNVVTPTKIYQTINDGAAWQDISPDTTATGIGNAVCQFLDANTGYFAAGENFYSTTDGGANWITQNLGRYTTAINFFDANHGTLGLFDGTFNYFGGMMTTTDGGATWVTTDLLLTGSVIGEVGQLSQTVSYAAPVKFGAYNQLKFFKTTNNGISWDTILVPGSLPDASLSDIHFKDVSNGMVAINGFSGVTYFYKTADGGVTWTFQDSLTVLGITDLQLTPNTGYLAGGETGNIYKLGSSLAVPEAAVAGLEIYPNPVAHGQEIHWDATLQFDQLTILDLSGRRVYESPVAQNAAALPLLPAGMYLLRLAGESGLKTARLIVN
jgi:photosystem II stability/assembly factor-like uncharacterized protein